MATEPINLSSAAIGELTNIAASASTGDYYQTGSLSKNGGTLQIYIPIDIYSAIGYPASCVNKITFNYEIAQERYGAFSSAGTVSTGYKNSGGSYTQVKNHANGIGKGVTTFNGYGDEITGFYVSGNTVTLGMKITNVIASQTCYYRIRNVSFVIDYTPPPTYTISTGSSPSGTGTVTGGGTYEHGSTVTLTATPNTGYDFKHWDDGNTDNPRTITVTGEAKYTARFEVLHCEITTAVSPSGSGTVTGGATSAYGSTLTLTARPATGYKFVKWNDGNTDNPRSVTVTHNATYTATFEKLSYTISANVSPSGSGTVTGAGTYEYGGKATLTATPATGYKFVKWNDGVTTATRTVTVTAAATYTATFENAYIPVYVKTSQCQAVYIDETNKTIYFYGIIDYDTDEGGFDTVDGWHFKATRTIPTGTNIKLVKKIYIGTTRIL